MTFTCLCCGHSEAYASEDEAYDVGWDTPKHLPIAPLCPLCPTMLYAKMFKRNGDHYLRSLKPGEVSEHEPVHQRWKREGRPNEKRRPDDGP